LKNLAKSAKPELLQSLSAELKQLAACAGAACR
jgi:hypothetical protein